ncbi:hypothetical protein [uncultured Roseibium sp.]|uniref:hypothetical protein n=1 Tax=uncultured Roseibium sp. TaxID=1936171 RepID=UPI002639BEF9|nr:hypothetical protein [uncultured Roseibium sp.]
MPYILKTYETGTTLSQTSDAPQATGGFEEYAQAGWVPAAAGLGLQRDGVYRLDDPMPGGVKRKIRIVAIGAGLNAFTYVRDGVA